MNRSEYNSLDKHHVWHPYTRFSAIASAPLPLITKAKGIYLYDDEGNQYLDAIASWWACSLGHGHPRIIRAIQEQVAELQHSILGNLSHPRAIELATRLAELMPTRKRHVMFASDGASAVEAALKIAVQYWHNDGNSEKKRFAYLEGGYHGDTLGAVSVGFIEGFHKPFESILFPAHELPVPAHIEDELACFEKTERIFADHGEELAGLILEPLCQGAAGMRMYSPEYLARLAELCKKHRVLLIADEIATGFGRTGKMFAFEYAGIDPDIVCVGKAMSAGYLPISAAIVKDAIYETFTDTGEDHSFYHGHTFCGNPIAAAAAIAALQVHEEIDIAERAMRIQRAFEEKLSGLTDLPSVKEIRILGGIAAVELEGEDIPGAMAKEEALPPAQKVREALLKKRVVIRPLGNIVYLMPPLTIGEEELERLLEAFCDAIEAV